MVEAAQGLPGVEIVAVFSRNLERAQGFTAQHIPMAVPLDSMDTLVNTVDAVYVATSPDRHLQIIEGCCSAGLSVLCEKPLTPNLADTERALSAASQAGVVLVEALWTLALPAFRATRQQLEKTRHQKPPRLYFDFSYPIGSDAPAHLLDPEYGGVLLDRAVYGYAAAIDLFGPVVSQRVNVARDKTGLDRNAELQLFHADGKRSLITISFDLYGSNRLDVAMDAGLLTLGPPALAAERTHYQPYFANAQGSTAKHGLMQRLKSRPELRSLKLRWDLQRGERYSYRKSPYIHILEHFTDLVAHGRKFSPMIPPTLSRDIAFWVSDAKSASPPAEEVG